MNFVLGIFAQRKHQGFWGVCWICHCFFWGGGAGAFFFGTLKFGGSTVLGRKLAARPNFPNIAQGEGGLSSGLGGGGWKKGPLPIFFHLETKNHLAEVVGSKPLRPAHMVKCHIPPLTLKTNMCQKSRYVPGETSTASPKSHDASSRGSSRMGTLSQWHHERVPTSHNLLFEGLPSSSVPLKMASWLKNRLCLATSGNP